MTVRETVEALANEQGVLSSDQACRLVNAHGWPFSDYLEETGADFRAESVLVWLGY